MKKISFIGILLIVLILPIANAQQPAEDAGVTPDSFLWGLDKALDNLNLLLTFDKGEKAKKGIEIARERLLEVKAMVEENKLGAAEKAKEEHGKTLVKVNQNINEIEDDDSTEEIKEVIEIEKELEELNEDVEQTFDEVKVKIEVKGELNQQQKDLIDSILSGLQEQTREVEIEIKNKKDKTKIKIKTETGKSEKEVEEEVDGIEEEKGLADIKKEKAVEEIENAKEDLEELEKDLQEHKAEGHVADEKPITQLMDNARKRLSNADEAFKNNDFGEAFGQANAARQLIKNADRILEKVVEKFEEEQEEEEQIDVEIEDGKAKIEIEVNDEKLKFSLETADKNTIVQEIAAKTGLSVDEVTKLTDFEEEEGKEEVKESKDKKSIIIKNEEVSLKCDSDADCLLINKDLGFGCCWAGACESIDYSLDKYASVNKESFLESRKENCPKGDLWGAHTSEEKIQKYEACGSAPGCPSGLNNNNFVAKCMDNLCTKLPK